MPVKKIAKYEDIQPALQWAFSTISKGLESGPVLITLDREARNSEQNKKGWAMFNDLSQQVEWCGQKLTPEDWKDLLTALFEKQRLVPGLDGGFVALGGRTSKYSKERYSEFIEQVYAVGAERGVSWSEPALAAYQQYKRA